MALLVVGIHTEPFGFNIWLDRGFGIVTRLCVPFFFVCSSYLYFSQKDADKLEKAKRYVLRIFTLYLLWSIVYLPFDIEKLAHIDFLSLLDRFLWSGNDHALWYLCGSIVGFLILFFLKKIIKSEKVIMVIAFLLLLVGCLKSTWAPLTESIIKREVVDLWGSRNGLFYAFPYYSLGMIIAHEKEQPNLRKLILGFSISMLLLIVESIVFVVVFHTDATILWISVLPLSYFFFKIVRSIQLPDKCKQIAKFCRNMSTVVYTSHHLFLYLFSDMKYVPYFLVVSICSLATAFVVVYLSRKRLFNWLKYSY